MAALIVEAGCKKGQGYVHPMIAVYVTDETRTPVTGLVKSSFKVWCLNDQDAGEVDIDIFNELSADIPSTDVSGVYLLKLGVSLVDGAPSGNYVFLIAVTGFARGGAPALKGRTLASVVDFA